MGGLSFLNGLFLAGAAVAVVPVIIHLVQRRRIQQVVFGSVRFLRKMSRRVVRRRRLTELLLILLRALALAVLAFAFARPFLWRAIQRVGAETILGDEAALILIDNSYSMSAQGRLESAKKQARELLAELDPTVKVGVASFSTQFQLLCPIGSDLPEARRAIDEIQQSWRGTALALILEQADRMLAQRSEEYRRVIVVSDFQRSAWRNPGGWKLSKGTAITVKDVSDEEVPNVLIERVAVPRLVVAGGSPEVVSAKIVNLNEGPVRSAEVVFKVGGKVVEKTRVNIRPRSDMPIRFRYAFKDPGDAAGSIGISFEDGMQADNVAHFCVHVTPRVSVLLVNGEPSRQLVRNDGFFLKMALAPPVEGRSSPFSVTETTPERLSSAQLKDVDVVLMANVEKLSPAARDALKGFVDRGGGVCFLCGGKTAPEAFNASLADLAPCRLWRKAMQEGQTPAVISMVNLKHEIFSPFSGPRTGNLAAAEFVQYYLVKPLQAASVLARFNTGHPALLEMRVGKGKSILFPSAMDLEWNNLCLKSIFVPFVHQLTKRLCAEQSAGVRNVVVGDRVAYRLPAEVKKVQLRTPEGETRELQPHSTGGGDPAQAVAFTPDRPGIYELSYANHTARFGVNIDSREPDLRQLDTRELVSSVQPGPLLSVRDAAGVRALVGRQTARERAEGQQKLWVYLIGFVLVALAVEMILAARAGTA